MGEQVKKTCALFTSHRNIAETKWRVKSSSFPLTVYVLAPKILNESSQKFEGIEITA